MTVVDIQISPGHADWPRLRDTVLAAETAGFGAAWVFDHLSGGALGGDSMLECCALLGALAEATSTIELGTMVANVWNRQPGTLVTAAASVTAIAGGRQVHLGIGAGSSPTSKFAAEQRTTGAEISDDLGRRHARVETTIELARRMWAEDRGDEFSTFPLPRPVPTLVVGANSLPLSRLAGRLADGVNVAWRHPRRDEFLAACDDLVGDRPFLRTVYALYDEGLLDPEHPDRVAMSRRGVDRLVLAELGPPRLGG